jgi:hypothetical protein
MNNQTNIYFTIINTDNTCIEKEITDFIVSDNNIAKDICNSVDKYKFLINNLSIDSKVVSFMIKIIMNTKIIYNQMFNLKNKDNIVSSTSNTVFVYNETLEIFTKLWIYIPKTIFDIIDKVVEPIIEQTIELQLLADKPVVEEIVEKPLVVEEIVEKPLVVEKIVEKPLVDSIVEKPVEVQPIIEKTVEIESIVEKSIEPQINKEEVISLSEKEVYLDMPKLISLEESTIILKG